MANEHRIIESNILSGNRIGSHNVIIVAAIPVLAITTVAVLAILPHLSEIWIMIEALTFTLVLCLMTLAIAFLIYICYRFRIDSRHRERQSRFFQWSEGAAWLDDTGKLIPLSAEHERAKLPMPRTEVTEIPELSAEDKEIIDRSRVLTMYLEEGKGMHKIADETGISYPKVRNWCNTAKAYRLKYEQTDQVEA